MRIFHTTSEACARSILKRGFFLVSAKLIGEDRVANFHEGSPGANECVSVGCTMEFEWTGPLLEINGGVMDLAPGILYRQNWMDTQIFWRFALRPGTNEGLNFRGAILDGGEGAGGVRILQTYTGKVIRVSWIDD